MAAISEIKLGTLLANLKIIGLLQPYDKLNTNDDILYIDSGYMQCLIRYYYGSNRGATISRLSAIYNDLANIFNGYTLSELYKFANNITPIISGNNKKKREKLAKFKTEKRRFSKDFLDFIINIDIIKDKIIMGLSNLIITYKDDGDITQAIENIKSSFINLFG